MSNASLPGNLNLVSVFESEAARLVNAAREGTILYGARNIRDSGEPVEAALLALFNRRLPNTYCALSGYFYSEEAVCSPQIDIMICAQHEMHGLGPGDYGRDFTPFTSVRVLGEVKKSSYDIAAAFTQISKQLESWRTMQARSQQIVPGVRSYIEQPLSFVFFADSSSASLENVKTIYMDDGLKPDYLIFLDRGLIVASYDILFKRDALSFHDRRQRGEWWIHRPLDADYQQGRVLLWMYFAVAAALHLSQGNHTSHLSFVNVAERYYRLNAVKAVSTASEW